jgi:hypothetical protein
MKSTVTLRENGRVRGELEIATGRVFDPRTGATLEQLTPMGDKDVALADYAARYYHANIARQVGRPVHMADSGRLVTMDLAQGDVHTDAALPNYAAGYSLAGGLADIACPVVLVDKASNKFNTWDKENAFKRVLPNGGTGGGAVPEVNPSLSQDNYSTVEYALGAFVPTQIQANADAPLKPYQAAVKRVMNALLLEREVRVATLLTATGNWDSSVYTTLGATAKWNAGSTSDPVADLHARIESSYAPVTGVIMSELVAHDFQRNSSTQKYIAYKDSAKPLPSASEFAALLDLPPIYVAKMKYISSGTTLSYVWGNDVVLLHSPPSNPPTDQEDVATAYTFRWNGGDAPDGTMNAGMMVRTYFDPKRGSRGGTMVVCVHNDAEKITSKYVGGLIKSAHQ